MTSEFSAKALAKVEIAAISCSIPGTRTTASPTGTLQSIATSTRSCRLALLGWRAGWSGDVCSACSGDDTPISVVPRTFASSAASNRGALIP